MTKLIRVQEDTYKELHKLAGRIQSKTGKKISLDKAIRELLAQKPGKQPPKGQKEAKTETTPTGADAVKWFSLHHKQFRTEK